MLLGKDGGGHQIHHLLILLDCLESRPDGDLCFPVTHVPADQPVHDPVALHIPLHRLDSQKLVLCLLKGEHFFKFLLPDRILSISIPFLVLPCRVEFHQVSGDLSYRATHPGLGLVPLLSAQPVEFWLLSVRSGILLDQIQLGSRDIKVPALSIGDLHIIFGHLIHLDLLDPPVDAQPVVLMDHIIPGFELGKILDLAPLVSPVPALFLYLAEDIRL